jgi:DNA-directed RNA polymerase II subunit RPB2
MDDLFDDANEFGAGDDVEMNLDMDVEITQEDAWVVINAFFEKRGLVKQQLDSFDQFIVTSIQEMVDDAGQIVITPENQFIPGKEAQMVRENAHLFFFF